MAAVAMTRLPETVGKPMPTSLIDIDVSKESLTPPCCRSYQRMGDEEEEQAAEMRTVIEMKSVTTSTQV